MSPRSSTPLSNEYIILGFAALGPVHGYDLHKQLNSADGISSIWHVKQSQLYALLDKLESLGYLRADAAPGAAYAPRKEYRLTAAGREALDAWVFSPVTHARDMRQGFLARYYFARQAGAEAAVRLVEAQIDICLEWQHQLILRLAQVRTSDNFQQIVDSYRLNQINAILYWLEECKAMPAP